jgi:predicted DNA-binding transcriptional regulator AlpA
MADKYLSAPQVRDRLGGISDMTLWRWLNDDTLTFPKPLVINRRRFFALDEIEEFEAAHSTRRSDEKL